MSLSLERAAVLCNTGYFTSVGKKTKQKNPKTPKQTKNICFLFKQEGR